MEETWISEIGKVIINLITEGGDRAIDALIWYLVYLLIRILIIGGVICSVIHMVYKGAINFLETYNKRNKERISLISESVSKDFQVSFKAACTSLENAATMLETHLEKLEASSPISKDTETKK